MRYLVQVRRDGPWETMLKVSSRVAAGAALQKMKAHGIQIRVWDRRRGRVAYNWESAAAA